MEAPRPCVAALLRLLREYAWLPRVRVIDFLAPHEAHRTAGDAAWAALPAGWRAHLDAMVALPAEDDFVAALLRLTSAPPAFVCCACPAPCTDTRRNCAGAHESVDEVSARDCSCAAEGIETGRTAENTEQRSPKSTAYGTRPDGRASCTLGTTDLSQNTSTVPNSDPPNSGRHCDCVDKAFAQAQENVSAFASLCFGLSFACVGEGAARRAAAVPRNTRNERMGAKKRYEVGVLQAFICDAVRRHGLRHAVDVGAGQGYLALGLLRADPDLRVLALEGAAAQAHGAIERAALLAADASGAESVAARLAVRRVFVTRDTRPYDAPPPGGYLMYALHACGSLSEALLHMFCADRAARVLVAIGCCYNLISAPVPQFGGDHSNTAPCTCARGDSFPMSARVADALRVPGAFVAGDDEKMVACQAPRRWAQAVRRMALFMRRHYYRALLQPLLGESRANGCAEEEDTPALGHVSNSALASFTDYARAALAPLGAALPSEDTLIGHAAAHPTLARRIAVLWTLRALMGPPIEALILLDRFFFLAEAHAGQDAAVSLVSLLDPLESPRHMALVVERRSE